jgi:histidinol-phosphate phosphatase family protein
MALAARALAGRGHEVTWLEAGEGARRGGWGWAAVCSRVARGGRHDVVLGSASDVAGALAAGWVADVRCGVLAAGAGDALRAGRLARWGAHALPTWLLVAEDDAEAFLDPPLGLGPEQVALWSPGPPSGAGGVEHADTEILERACERALVRARRRALAPAVFLDRDGTLVREVGYLADVEDMELLPGVPLALHKLRATNFALVLVSNQSGVGRGFFPLERVYQANARLRRLLARHDVELDAIYFCPHRPEEECACRKPRAGLLERAAEDLLLDLRHSYMIGDKLLDAQTARGVGATGVLVRTGYGRDEEGRLTGGSEPRPDLIAEDLLEAAEWVVRREAD